MNVKEKKIEILKNIQEVEDDIVTLQNSIERVKKFVNNLTDESTLDDIEDELDLIDIENGLKHIYLE